jgi:hypothetical protein
MTMSQRPVFRVGDRALFRFGPEDVEVEVIEHRGPIGVRGRHLVRIRMPVTASDPVEIEVAEADLTPLADAA